MSEKYGVKPHLYVLLFGIFCNSTVAQNEFNTESGNQFELSMKTEFGSLYIFFYRTGDEKQTTFFTLSPTLKIQIQSHRQLFSLEAQSHHRKYQDFSIDDHTNFAIAPKYQYKLSDDKALFINTSLINLYEKRGTGLSLGNGESLNKGDDIEVTKISGGYLFGQSDSVAKIKVEIGNLQSKYQTRRDTTYLLDKETGFFDVSFDYLLSGQSYLSSNIGFEKVESKNNAVLDNERYIALMGLKWQTTLISQFSFLLGYQAIKFENATFADDNAFKWRVDLNWHPINFTKIAFRTERDFEEANRLSDSYRVVDKYEFKLTSEISDFFQVVAILGMNKEQIVYQQDKEDEDYIFSQVQLNYQRTEWLSFFIKYEYNDLDSTESEYNYQRNSISIGFNASL